MLQLLQRCADRVIAGEARVPHEDFVALMCEIPFIPTYKGRHKETRRFDGIRRRRRR